MYQLYGLRLKVEYVTMWQRGQRQAGG